MKQAHEVAAGENRRGRAKRRGRTVGRGWDLARKWIAATHAAKGKQNPKEGAPIIRGRSRFDEARTLEGRPSSGEDEPAIARPRGTTQDVEPPGRAGNRDDDVAAGNRMSLQGLRSQHSGEQPTS